MIVGWSPQTGQVGVAPQLEGFKFQVHGAEGGEAADGRPSDAENQLDDLIGLEGSDDARQNAHDAALGAAWHGAGVRRLRIHAAVARAMLAGSIRVGQMGREDGDHSFEAEDRAVDVGLLEDYAGVVHAVAGGEIVGAVDDDVVIFHQLQNIGAVDDGFVFDDFRVGVQVLEPLGGCLHLVFADVGDAKENLPLEIAWADDIDIGQADGADAGGGQVEADGASQPSRSDA